MKSLVLVLAAAALVQGFQRPAFIEDLTTPMGSRIIQGSPAVNGQFPWQAFLLTTATDGNRYTCGASLLSNRWLLTAAHCLQNRVSAVVYLGHVNLNQAPVQQTTSDFRIHPNYNSNTLNNDIAIIGLNNLVPETVNIKYIPFAREPSNTFAGWTGTVSGFGKTSDDSSVSPILNYVGVRVVNNSECSAVFGSGVVIPSTICTVGLRSQAQGICQGDSGGPLVTNVNGVTTLIGVVSFVSGDGCATSAPNGFVRPSHFVTWINSITGL